MRIYERYTLSLPIVFFGTHTQTEERDRERENEEQERI